MLKVLAMQVGGIANAELNGLEMELLFLLNFSLHMKREAYDDYIETLLRRQVKKNPSSGQ